MQGTRVAPFHDLMTHFFSTLSLGKPKTKALFVCSIDRLFFDIFDFRSERYIENFLILSIR
ncbi:hypothetical protein Phum_PHUM266050 [Pediculus humanus corporis]|uniref:Uncharacterized protein n=1 Tax=Pediculus humanus subsp. corporis TaxID=121224 RepID=E0VKJ7_PEDHC|nr:uncharacterized protein Phum_PHUM266050 [Pediculus humanus corporis]EEB13903.1 hypothetical protein Phum_PHUM266050 [Pediculus humanus corporis]